MVLYVIAVLFSMVWLYFMLDCVNHVAKNLGRIADELKAMREESKRQFDLERQYPRRP